MTEVQSIAVVIADDDEDDYLMIKSAIAKLRSNYSVTIVGNGVDLINHLEYLDKNKEDFPGLILLDINMPMKNGKETLQEIREHPKYRFIPVVMLTSS
ncbi:MAG: response regulator, partial [Chloroflexi bacterium]